VISLYKWYINTNKAISVPLNSMELKTQYDIVEEPFVEQVYLDREGS